MEKILSLSSTAKSVDVINSPFGVRASNFVVESTIGKSASKSTILAYFQQKETQLNLGASERRIASRYAVKSNISANNAISAVRIDAKFSFNASQQNCASEFIS